MRVFKLILPLWLLLLALPMLAQNTDCDDTRVVYPDKEPLDGELRILSWNIKMLPRLILRTRYGPIKRSRLIPDHLKDDQIDIIVFQECFDVRSRRILKRRLKDDYPYIVGPANKSWIPGKTNSGIMIFSKVPIKKLGTVKFSECSGYDCWAGKGVLLVEGEWQGQTFQVAGTHLQAGGTNEIKISQYKQMQELLEEHEKPGVPQFLCGDYNTHHDDETLFTELMACFKCENGEYVGDQKFTSDGPTCDMKNNQRQGIIDFIFYKGHGFKPHFMERSIRTYRQRWDEKHRDLSDHYAILMRVVFFKSSEGEPIGD